MIDDICNLIGEIAYAAIYTSAHYTLIHVPYKFYLYKNITKKISLLDAFSRSLVMGKKSHE